MSFPLWLLMDVYVWRKQESFLLHPLSLLHHCFGRLSTQHGNRSEQSPSLLRGWSSRNLSCKPIYGFPRHTALLSPPPPPQCRACVSSLPLSLLQEGVRIFKVTDSVSSVVDEIIGCACQICLVVWEKLEEK